MDKIKIKKKKDKNEEKVHIGCMSSSIFAHSNREK